MANRVLNLIGRNFFVLSLGALMMGAIGATTSRLGAIDEGCADYICKGEEDCAAVDCGLCAKNERCINKPEN
jgi:hypothetical protein